MALQLPTTGTISGLENNLAANAALAALAVLSQGSSAPTTAATLLDTLAGLLWHDTATNTLKVRDQADTAWIALFRLNETAKLVGNQYPGPTWNDLAANYSVVAGDDGKAFWNTSHGITVTLPAPSSCAGMQASFAGQGLILTTPSGTFRPISGSPSSLTLADNEHIGVQSNGTDWRVFVSSPRVAGAVMSVAGNTGDVTAAQIQTAIGLASYALLASPTFTGTPAAPTPSGGDNSTKIATTAFVAAAVAALLASPALTGTPTAPTPSGGDNSTKIATTAFVAAAVAALLVSPTFTGTPKAPTPDPASNSTRLATTEWVRANFTLSPGGGVGGSDG